jgi:hypothetical protein
MLHSKGVHLQAIVTDRCLAAINAIDNVFPTVPSLICRWHLNQAIFKQIRKREGIYKQIPATKEDGTELNWLQDSPATRECVAAFYKLIEAKSLTEWESLCSAFELKYAFLKDYLAKEWWPYRERFCAVWTNKYRHFGETASSRVEGQNKCLKEWINSSNITLITLFERLTLFWIAAHARYEEDIAKSRNIPITLASSFFSSVRKIIHIYALKKLNEDSYKPAMEVMIEINRREQKWRHDQKPGKPPKYRPFEPCTHTYRATIGILCKHQVLNILLGARDGVLLPIDFHEHWWMDRRLKEGLFTAITVRSPRKKERYRNRKETHARGDGITSTRRQLTGTELGDANVASQAIQEIQEGTQAAWAAALEHQEAYLQARDS